MTKLQTVLLSIAKKVKEIRHIPFVQDTIVLVALWIIICE